jgi:hypothetical protein
MSESSNPCHKCVVAEKQFDIDICIWCAAFGAMREYQDGVMK